MDNVPCQIAKADEPFHVPAQVEKVMKALFIRRLHLWPRFETSAKEVLDAVDKDIQVGREERERMCSQAFLAEACE